MRYAWIAQHKRQWPVSLMCSVLGVSASVYFEHHRCKTQAAKPSARFCEAALLAHIRTIHAQVKAEYGWPKVYKELLARGLHVGKERVRKLMQRHEEVGTTVNEG